MPQGRRLTRRDKEIIRNSPCHSCGTAPPFANGTRCQPHRIPPRHKGGRYIEGNVIPLCPSCHDIAHGGTGRAPLIGAARLGGLIGGPMGGFATMTLEKHREIGRLVPREQRVKNGKKSMSKLTAAQRTALAKSGNAARSKEGRQASFRGMKKALLARGIRLTGAAARFAQATHCIHGHAFDEANTYWYMTARGGKGRFCRACAADRGRIRYREHREGILALNKTERVRAAKARYRKTHRAQLKVANKAWRSRTREARRKADRARYARNPEKYRKRARDWGRAQRAQQRQQES